MIRRQCLHDNVVLLEIDVKDDRKTMDTKRRWLYIKLNTDFERQKERERQSAVYSYCDDATTCNRSRWRVSVTVHHSRITGY